jgi:hypothetical protein
LFVAIFFPHAREHLEGILPYLQKIFFINCRLENFNNLQNLSFFIQLFNMSEPMRIQEPVPGFTTAWKDTLGINMDLMSGINYEEAIGRSVGSADDPLTGGRWGAPLVSPTPEACKSGGAANQLFRVVIPVGALAMQVEHNFLTNTVEVVSQEDYTLVLGPQREELLAMAERAATITPEQEDEMGRISGIEGPGMYGQLKKLARERGRHNSEACLDLVWKANGELGEWGPVGGAFLAVAHRDLLKPEERQAYEAVLYKPWREVIENA